VFHQIYKNLLKTWLLEVRLNLPWSKLSCLIFFAFWDSLLKALSIWAFISFNVLSVPSDIQKSIENLTSGSQTDLLSSVTISELSTSVDSFNVSLSDDVSKINNHSRRSASLDSLNDTESPLTRTLKEINAQIDKALSDFQKSSFQ
jgi:hypothetical protein